MGSEIKIASEVLNSVASVAKKITGSVMTVNSEGVITSVEGLWMINKAKVTCEEGSSASFTSDVPLAKLKKIQGEISIAENGAGCSLSGTSRTGDSISETVEVKSMDSIPEENGLKVIGKIKSNELAELLASKLTSSLPTYLMFSKKSAVSFILNEFNAGVTRMSGEFDAPFKAAMSKNVVSKLYSILSKLKTVLSFEVSAFKCWDSTYIKLDSSSGMIIIVETMDKPVPAFPSKLAPPPALFTMTAAKLGSLLISKPLASDQVTIEGGDSKTEVMASSLSPVFNVLDKDSDIHVSISDSFTYLCDNKGHIFVVGNAKT